MKKETLDLLLRGGHISMSKRIELGEWPHPPLKIQEIINHIKESLLRDGYFPFQWEPHEEGNAVDERGVLEVVRKFRIVYRVRRHNPINPFQLVKETEKLFFSTKKAIHFYIKWQLYLPGDLDGWEVVG